MGGNGRPYDPATGRFQCKDRIKDDLNTYRYVRNNPVNAVDPSGTHKVGKPYGGYSMVIHELDDHAGHGAHVHVVEGSSYNGKTVARIDGDGKIITGALPGGAKKLVKREAETIRKAVDADNQQLRVYKATGLAPKLTFSVAAFALIGSAQALASAMNGGCNKQMDKLTKAAVAFATRISFFNALTTCAHFATYWFV